MSDWYSKGKQRVSIGHIATWPKKYILKKNVGLDFLTYLMYNKYYFSDKKNIFYTSTSLILQS
jgi:hypothetical protein